MRILIDPGHGIDTPGKMSPDGVFREYLWNRQVADLVVEFLKADGVDVSLVVTETNDISLRNRVNRVNTICNQVGASNVLLVSIHANAAGNGKEWMNGKGWSCYTSPGNTRSDRAAEIMYRVFERRFPERRMRKDMSDGDSDIEANFYVLTKSRCPAILIENFFYDNREECEWLLKEDTKIQIAHAIECGIVRYILNEL